MSTQIIFIVVCGLGLLLIAAATHFSGQGSLDNIVSITQNALSALLQHRISSSGLLLTKSLAGR